MFCNALLTCDFVFEKKCSKEVLYALKENMKARGSGSKGSLERKLGRCLAEHVSIDRSVEEPHTSLKTAF